MSAVVTVGNFDGVHRGHLALVDRAVAVAATHGAPAVALTFDPHPAAVLRPDAAPGLLQSVAERVAALRAAGLDDVVVRRFDAALAALTPDEFVADVLVGELGAVAVVVGENFRFGRRAAGDAAGLREMCAAVGVAVEVVPLVGEDGAVVSSSALRAALAAGDVAAVTEGLGRPYALAGVAILDMVNNEVSKEDIAKITGRSKDSLNYKIFEGQTTINGKTNVRSIKKHWFVDPTIKGSAMRSTEEALKLLFAAHNETYVDEADIQARIEAYAQSREAVEAAV